MKTAKFRTKLVLNKTTIAHLNVREMNSLYGGIETRRTECATGDDCTLGEECKETMNVRECESHLTWCDCATYDSCATSPCASCI